MEPVILNEYLYERGRGVELRSCRLTVNELYPMLTEAQCSDARMLELYPITPAELDAVKRHIADHADALAAENAAIDARIERKIAEQDTPEMRARHQQSRETMDAFKAFHTARKARPELFLEIPDESLDARRERLFTAFRAWRAAAETVAEVG